MTNMKMSGQLANPGNVLGAVYANQNIQNATDVQDTEILYYENGAPTSSANLTFDGTELGLNGAIRLAQATKVYGVVEFENAIGQVGNANLAIGPDPFVVATPGPRLFYRTREMPIFWSDQFIVTSQNLSTVFTCLGPGSVGSGVTAYFPITNGPFIGNPGFMQTGVINVDLNANSQFWPVSATVGGAALTNLATNGRVESVQIRGTGANTNPARVTVSIWFFPPA